MRRRVRDGQGRRARPAPPSTRTGATCDAPLVVDCLGWRRVLGSSGYQPPDAPLSRGLEVHPGGAADDLEIWIDRGYVPAGYSWSFPARDEVRVGVGSFDPRFHVKEPTVRLARDLDRDAVRYQGNWIPHKLRRAAEDDVFFVGDSAGHCLPLTAEGIRTAFYFGIACGRELRAVVDGDKHRDEALRDYAAFSAAPSMEVRVAAAGSAADPPRAAAPARAGAARDGQRPLRALGVRPLSADRAARVRRDPATGPGPPRRADRRLTQLKRPGSQPLLGAVPA